jgi:hypothetical protein
LSMRAGRCKVFGMSNAKQPCALYDCPLILSSVQDETNYGMLRTVTDDRSERWQDLDG